MMAFFAWWRFAKKKERYNFRKYGTIPRRFLMKQCTKCGGPFFAKANNQKICSGTCPAMPVWWNLANKSERDSFLRRSQVPIRFQVRKCEACMGVYVPKSSQQTFCTETCNKAIQNHRLQKWRKLNPEKQREKARQENIKYRSKRSAYRKKYKKQRYDNDNVYRLVHLYRSRVNQSLKKQSASKTCSTFKMIGCTGQQFMNFLLSHENNNGEFTADNYGTVWHVDHVRPLASFDLSKPSDVKAAFHYSNCQPMLAVDNLQKGSLYQGVRHVHTVRSN